MTENDAVPETVNLDGVLPLARIKKILKLQPDINIISADAVKLIRLVSESYLRCFVGSSLVQMRENGRKTIMPNDLEQVIQNDDAFEILNGALDDWPEPKAKESRANQGEVQASHNFFEAPGLNAGEVEDLPLSQEPHNVEEEIRNIRISESMVVDVELEE